MRTSYVFLLNVRIVVNDEIYTTYPQQTNFVVKSLFTILLSSDKQFCLNFLPAYPRSEMQNAYVVLFFFFFFTQHDQFIKIGVTLGFVGWQRQGWHHYFFFAFGRRLSEGLILIDVYWFVWQFVFIGYICGAQNNNQAISSSYVQGW